MAQHQHSADQCPAAGVWAAWFRSHLSAANAARHGGAIQAEAVIVAEHRLILTVEAARRESVEALMAFFARFGAIQVSEAATVEEAVARGQCPGHVP